MKNKFKLLNGNGEEVPPCFWCRDPSSWAVLWKKNYNDVWPNPTGFDQGIGHPDIFNSCDICLHYGIRSWSKQRSGLFLVADVLIAYC